MLLSNSFFKVSKTNESIVAVHETILREEYEDIKILPSGKVFTYLDSPDEKTYTIKKTFEASNKDIPSLEKQIEEALSFFPSLQCIDRYNDSSMSYLFGFLSYSDFCGSNLIEVHFDNQTFPKKAPYGRFQNNDKGIYQSNQIRLFDKINYYNDDWNTSPKTLIWFIAQFSLYLSKKECYREFGVLPGLKGNNRIL